MITNARMRWVLTLSIVMTLPAWAQPEGPRRGGELRQLSHELELTEEQQEQVQTLFQEQRSKVHQQRLSQQTQRDEFFKAVEEVLTEEQREQMQDIRAERQGERRHAREGARRMEHRRGPSDRAVDTEDRGLQCQIESLNLTEEQKEQLKPLLEAQREHMALRQAEMRTQREQLHSQIGEILTEEQLEKWNIMRAERRGRN